MSDFITPIRPKSCWVTVRRRHFDFNTEANLSVLPFPFSKASQWIIFIIFFLWLNYHCIFTGSDGFSHHWCILHSVVQYLKQHQHVDVTKSTRLDSCLITQLDINQEIILLDILTWNIILYTVPHLLNAFLSFFSSMSLLNLGGDGSLCMTASSPTDSTGEINNQSFAEGLSFWERNAAMFDMLQKQHE